MNIFSVTAQLAQTQPPAQGGCQPGSGINLADCLRLSNDTAVKDTPAYTSIGALVDLIVTNLFVIAGVVLFLLIIYAGFVFVTQGKAGAEQAKTIITNSIAGFILMLSSYWIVQLIQFITGADVPL